MATLKWKNVRRMPIYREIYSKSPGCLTATVNLTVSSYLTNTAATTQPAIFILPALHHGGSAQNAPRSVICVEWIENRAPFMWMAGVTISG